MTFVFQCPQGHRLEGNVGDAGRPAQCPACGQFIEVPSPVQGKDRLMNGGRIVHEGVGGASCPNAAAGSHSHDTCFSLNPNPVMAPTPATQGAAAAPVITTEPIEEVAPEFFHIPCPNGHELETTPDLINRPVRCPKCGVEFVLRKENSVEFQTREQRRREAYETRIAKTWLQLAIGVGIAVVLAISLMIAYSR